MHGRFSCGPAPNLGMPALSCSISELYELRSRGEIGRVRVPVLLHLHGAFGLSETEVILAALARRTGFVFFAPDSFARKMRFSNCQIENCEIGTFPLADLYRRAELLDAVRRVEASPFIEPGPLVVSGFSEGGAAVSIWGGAVQADAYIIAGWSCSAPKNWGWADGLRTPDHKAVLHIQADRDPWFTRPGWRRRETAKPPWVREIIVDSDDHYVCRDERAQNAVTAFLDGIRSARGPVQASSEQDPFQR
ncbi:dienelactone hydrolase [Paraburkholderia sp. BL25I1N1]|nr:dienelactone hydrolase [Paraburkholderia sp. BL25I1N1]